MSDFEFGFVSSDLCGIASSAHLTALTREQNSQKWKKMNHGFFCLFAVGQTC